MLAMGDALAVSCYEKRGFTAADFARYHPGGRLGRRLVLVEQLMHAGEDLPSVGVDADVRAAVEEMNGKRLGVVCLVSADGRLEGILTDGDIRRLVLRSDTPLAGPVRDAMTTDPSTMAPDALAVEALATMEERKITSLPVVDDDRKLLGVVQIHDLWRTELF
jgi:arabinose-5-phosphate isomerase